MKHLYLLIWMICMVAIANGQALTDSLTFSNLHQKRMSTDRTGVKVLGAWAIANIAAGTTGYLIADDKEWKAFHGTNAVWNVVNLGIAGMGMVALKKEMQQNAACPDMLHSYEARKRLYLINGGLDLAYIGGGLLLHQRAAKTSHPEFWRGAGKSVSVQGAALLLFDSIMYAAHARRNKAWYGALSHICMTGNGIGLRYGL